jgi:arylsulfatase A-like enzyme
MSKCLTTFILTLVAFASAGAEPPKPNILLIMADDLGFSDLGCYGGEIATPNLDSLAENGLRFTQFYNTARCWPSRAALLTGHYAQEVRRDTLPGISSGGRGVRPDWARLLPEILKGAGYRSYHAGKWHIDGKPLENGFDRSFSSDGGYFRKDGYLTSVIADQTIAMLDEHTDNHAAAPFFHYLAFTAPHFPLHALPEDIAVYKDTYDVGWEAIRMQRWQRMQKMGLLDKSAVSALSRVESDLGPPYHFPNAFEILGSGEVNKPVPWSSLTDEQKKFQSTKMAIHAAMIHRMDIDIGRVFDRIKKMGQWENTLVMFLSDNGASAEIMVRGGGHDPKAEPGSAATYLCLGPGWSTVSNTPFRRHKTWTHEGGTSTPLLMSWPKGIDAAGQFRRTPGHVIDVVPTILELAGAKTRDDAPAAPGKSLVANFVNDSPAQREALWWFHDGNKAIRKGDWKAVAPVNEPWELYNLANDRTESRDLAIPEGAKLMELVAEWDKRLEVFVEVASRDLPAQTKKKKSRPDAMKQAQSDAKPKRDQVLINGEAFLLNDRHTFIMKPNKPADGNPWIFYGPTLNAYPDKAESWMHQQFLDAGIAVAGIDVGEAYGSPLAFPYFEALYQEMVKRGYSKKPPLLGRSRGGLWVSSWALKHPDRVAGIGGIYPVYDYTTYPGVDKAATAYNLSKEELSAQQETLNPIKRAAELAKAKIPVFIIHGTDDKVVPIAQNTEALEKAYAENGAADLIHVIKSEGQGHSFWEGFFHCQELVDFLIQKATH